jgi:hypothetical protein
MASSLQTSTVTFPDNTTQSTACMPITGGQFTNLVSLRSQTSGGGQYKYRQYVHNFTGSASGGTMNLMSNTDSYGDVHFMLTLVAYHSGRSYQSWQGVFGGYGANFSGTGGSGSFSLGVSGSAYGTLQVSWGNIGYAPSTYIGMQIFSDPRITVINGTLYS